MQVMKWSLKIARVAGIDLKIHLTFLIFLIWIGFTYFAYGGFGAAISVVVVVAISSSPNNSKIRRMRLLTG